MLRHPKPVKTSTHRSDDEQTVSRVRPGTRVAVGAARLETNLCDAYLCWYVAVTKFAHVHVGRGRYSQKPRRPALAAVVPSV